MPSGWTTSGIDWTNIRNNRTEDVIRELYLAVNERDYWIRYFMGGGGVVSGLTIPFVDKDEVGRIRVNTQLRYIYNTIQSWVLGSPSKDDLTNVNLNNNVFIDPSVAPTGNYLRLNTKDSEALENKYFDGWNTYNSADGSLSNLIQRDTSFLNTNIGDFRVNLDELEVFYLILQENLLSPMFYSIFIPSNSVIKFPQWDERFLRKNQNPTDPRAVDNYRVRGSSRNEPFNDYYNIYVNDENTIETSGYGYSYDFDGASPDSYFATSNHNYLTFSVRGYDGELYTPSELTTQSFVYNYAKFKEDYPPPVEDYNQWKIINNVVNGFITPTQEFPVPNININSGDYGELLFTQYGMPFIDLNKEGFLKYYTEATN